MILAVSFALLGSTLVALTVVPVLGTLLLARGDLSVIDDKNDGGDLHGSWLQGLYTPALLWSLRHKLATVLLAGGVTLASLGLVFVIPIRLFPSGSPDYPAITVELPTGASLGRTFAEVSRVEEMLDELKGSGRVEHYQVALGRDQQLS